MVGSIAAKRGGAVKPDAGEVRCHRRLAALGKAAVTLDKSYGSNQCAGGARHRRCAYPIDISKNCYAWAPCST
jgi:hypothetical protein